MPPRNKKQIAAAHDRRHENGLIAPGKKIVKQKPGQQPNGDAHASSSNVTTLTTPDTLRQRPSNVSNTDEVTQDFTDDKDMERAPNGSLADLEASTSPTQEQDEDSHAINGHAGKNGSILSKLTADSLITVVRSHSLLDVVTILLLLLQLPPALLVVVQFCFASMTFGNPIGSWSVSSFLSASEWFRSHGGNPSAVVSVIADACIIGLWSLLPVLKDFVLDLAPAVVAISLGGGSAANDSWRHTSICMSTVFLGNVFREKRRRHYLSNFAWACMSKLSFTPPSIPNLYFFPTTHHTSRSWARIILELHIVTHGIVRVIRRQIDRSSKASNSGSLKSEHESGSISTGSQSSASHDNTGDGARNISTDGRPPGPSPATREKGTSSGKRRKKQANFVRTQQPFWAAIASSKISVSKEIEQSQGERDNIEASANGVSQLGDASKYTFDDRVWVTKVGDTEIWFRVDLQEDSTKTGARGVNAEVSTDSTINGLEAFDVRVNGAYWSSVDSKVSRKDGDGTRPSARKIEGKIFGLTPAKNYFVEFVRLDSTDTISSTSIFTRPVTTSEQGANVSPHQETLRPSSPTTTLKTSIATAEAKLTDHKNRSNKARKHRQQSLRNLKQEVTDLQRNLSSSGNDERQRQRLIQYRQNIKQAEESAAELISQIENMGEVPQEDRDAYEASKKNWDEAMQRRDESRKVLESSKREGQKRVTEAQSDNAKVRGKKEKAESRFTSLNERFKSVTEENEAKRSAKVQNESEHHKKMETFYTSERNLSRDILAWEELRKTTERRIAQLEQQNHFFDNKFPQSLPHSTLPQTPESVFASVVSGPRQPPGIAPSAVISPFTNAQNPIGTPPIHSRQNSVRDRRHGRTSSMLSNVSGFTDAETAPSTVPDQISAAQEIARTGSNSPRDAKSPTQRVSAIGTTPMGRGSPKQGRK